jgi:hypothetical protein
MPEAMCLIQPKLYLGGHYTHAHARGGRVVPGARRRCIPSNARCLPVPLASCCCTRAWLSSHPGPGAARTPRRSPVGSTPCVRASCIHALALFYPPVDTGGLGSPPVRLGAHCPDDRHRHYPLPAVLRKVLCCRGGCHDAVACPSFKVRGRYRFEARRRSPLLWRTRLRLWAQAMHS